MDYNEAADKVKKNFEEDLQSGSSNDDSEE